VTVEVGVHWCFVVIAAVYVCGWWIGRAMRRRGGR